jgi:DNA-binding transcriptional LysR family regulator
MIYLLGEVFLFFLMLHALRAFAEANPTSLAFANRRGGLLRGRFDMAIGPGGLGGCSECATDRLAIVQIVQPPVKAESFEREVGDGRDGIDHDSGKNAGDGSGRAGRRQITKLYDETPVRSPP